MAQFDDSLKINGSNYLKSKTRVEIFGVGGLSTTDLTPYTKGIEYTETQTKEFGYSLGSNRPSHVGFGNIEADGTITFTDAGLDKLNKFAKSIGLPSYLYLGQVGSVSIAVSYTTREGQVKTDILEDIHFTTYTNGVNDGDVIYSREVPFMIGKISIGDVA